MFDIKRVFLSVAVGVALTTAAALHLPYVEYLLLPGIIVAAVFWPAGVHSDFGGSLGFLPMLVVIYGASIAAWSALAYLVAHSFGNLLSPNQPLQPTPDSAAERRR
jgi:hypothetical protein